MAALKKLREASRGDVYAQGLDHVGAGNYLGADPQWGNLGSSTVGGMVHGTTTTAGAQSMNYVVAKPRTSNRYSGGDLASMFANK